MVRHRRHGIPVVLGAFAVFVIASLACAVPATVGELVSTVQATQPPVAPPAGDTAAPPSDTPQPSDTPPPTDTPAPTDTPTLAPTLGPNFAAASVYGVSHLPNDKLLVSIQVPGGVFGDYKAYVENLPFACEILDQYPDRLYCNGAEPFGLYAAKQGTIEILSSADNVTVYQAQFTVPGLPTPTYTPSPTLKP